MAQLNTQFLKQRSHFNSAAFFVASFIFALILVALFPPFFSVNDDPYRSMILSGTGIASHPDAHLSYSNFLLGYFLKSLYEFAPNIQWYEYFLIFCHAFSFSLLFHLLLNGKKKALSVLFVFLLLTDIFLLYLSMFNYTTTAFLLSLSASLLWMRNSFNHSGKMLPVFLLFLLCFLVRKEVFYLTLLIVLPLFVLNAFLQKRERKFYLSSLYKVVLLLLLTTSLNVMDKRENDLRGGKHWNGVHQVLVEWFNYGKVEFNANTEPYFREVGWDIVDYRILMSPFLLWNVFDLKSLKQVESKSFQSTGFDFALGVEHVTTALTSKNSLLVLFWACLSLLYFKSIKKQDYVFAGLSFTWILFVLVLVGARLKMVPYVYIPVLTFFVLLCLLNSEKEEITWLKKISTLILVLATVWSFKAHAGVNQSRKESEKVYLEAIEKLNPKENQLYVVWGADLLVHFPRVLSGTLYEKMKLICTGWPLYTKVTEDRLNEFHIDNLYTALYEREDVFLIADAGRESDYVKFIKSHYGADVYFEQRFSDPILSVFKVRKR